MNNIAHQKDTCQRYNTNYVEAAPYLKLGIAKHVKQQIYPINGLRVFPEGDTTGWYVWAGTEFSDSPDFFLPLHIAHLESWCPEIIPYLGLPPGWRFLLAPGHEDVWFDPELLKD